MFDFPANILWRSSIVRYGFYFGAVLWGSGVDGSDGGSECDSEVMRTGIREGLGIEDPVSVGDRVGGGVRGNETRVRCVE